MAEHVLNVDPGNRIAAEALVWGPHAPRVLAIVPRDRELLPLGVVREERFDGGVETGTRGRVRSPKEDDAKQVLTQLRLTGLKLALLINFGEAHLKNGIKRIINRQLEDNDPPTISL